MATAYTKNSSCGDFLTVDLDDPFLNEGDIMHLKSCSVCSACYKDSHLGEKDENIPSSKHASSEGSSSKIPEQLRPVSDKLPSVSLSSDSLGACLKDSSISQLVEIPPCAWNHISSNVYKALKVSNYIVEPNYFLSARLHGVPYPDLNMDEIFREISNHQKVPSWNEVERHFEKLLEILDFEKCKDVADILVSDPPASERLLRRISQKLTYLLQETNCKWGQFAIGAASHLKSFFSDLLDFVQFNNPVPDSFFKSYVVLLFDFFMKSTAAADFSLLFREEQDLFLNLDPSKSSSSIKHVKAPFYGQCFGKGFLVGQFKQVREGEKRPEIKCVNQYEDEIVEHTVKDFEGKGVMPPTTNEETTVSRDLVDSHKIGLPDVVSEGLTVNLSKPVCGYRRLNSMEIRKVSDYLPQLLAGMMAAMQKRDHLSLKIGGTSGTISSSNENVQLGFAVDGFKLRFVRLVLCQKITSQKPTVHDIRNPNIKCHVFMTKEFNLFDKKHVKLFFQFLYAFGFMYRYT